jgi:hypothetical protein
MSDNKPTADLAAIIKSLRGYLLEKGHRIERGPSYEGQSKTPASVAEMVRRYERRGYTKYINETILGASIAMESAEETPSNERLRDRHPEVRLWSA